ncbi:cell division protein FtsQ/DivIB [Gardnerella sp. Marseille-Q9691]|uniref:cell division protein FtsQ/DivIB n=1 Tax=Gardnerella sp. Marseille-Q9691 TaxID=3390096 RepID=UPI0039704696
MGRVIVSKSNDSSENKPHPRTVKSLNLADANPNREEKHQGKFVDARRLPGLDFIKKTLSQTSGSFGMMTRPRIVNFKERLKERKSAYLKFTLKRVLAVIAVIAVLVALLWLLFFSPAFRLQLDDITISGSNEWVSEQKIESIASTQVDKSLFLVSSQEVIGQLKDIPGVTEAKVTKNFPHSLQITVRAQRPAAMLKTRESSKLTAVDAKGRVLNAVAQASIKGIPVIEVGDIQRSLNNRAVLEAVKIVSSLPESMRARVTKVSAKTQDSVETELGDVKRTIVWGDSSQIELKKAIVAKIIDDPSKIGDKHRLDVSAPVRPILK